MKTIDALGIECPMPVIMAKRVINEGEENFLVLVDNQVATENLEKMAKETGFTVEIKQVEEKIFEVEFKKSTDSVDSKKDESAYIVVFDSKKMGNGDEDFSKKLLEGFILALSEQDSTPEYIICYNEGVELSSINENTVSDLEKLASRGVKILSCGLCLDQYKLKESLKVGEITNMYKICQLMTQYKVVRP